MPKYKSITMQPTEAQPSRTYASPTSSTGGIGSLTGSLAGLSLSSPSFSFELHGGSDPPYRLDSAPYVEWPLLCTTPLRERTQQTIDACKPLAPRRVNMFVSSRVPCDSTSERPRCIARSRSALGFP